MNTRNKGNYPRGGAHGRTAPQGRPATGAGGLVLSVLRIVAVVLWIIAIVMVIRAVVVVHKSNTREAASAETPAPTPVTAEAAVTDDLMGELPEGTVEVDTGLFNVTLTVPADYIGEVTQEQLDEAASSKGYKSATLNSDGSVTYVMTRSQHNDLVDGVKQSIQSGLDDLVASADNRFTSIEANSDFTDFTVTLDGTELDFGEEFTALSLYIYGGMYNAFRGTSIDNVHIKFVSASTGAVIEEANSRDLGE